MLPEFIKFGFKCITVSDKTTHALLLGPMCSVIECSAIELYIIADNGLQLGPKFPSSFLRARRTNRRPIAMIFVRPSVCLSSGGSKISVRGMRPGSGPQFFRKGCAQLFYGRLLARIGVARIFKGWMCPGVDPGFLDFEGPERGAVGAKRRSADGGGIWVGAP